MAECSGCHDWFDAECVTSVTVWSKSGFVTGVCLPQRRGIRHVNLDSQRHLH